MGGAACTPWEKARQGAVCDTQLPMLVDEEAMEAQLAICGDGDQSDEASSVGTVEISDSSEDSDSEDQNDKEGGKRCFAPGDLVTVSLPSGVRHGRIQSLVPFPEVPSGPWFCSRCLPAADKNAKDEAQKERPPVRFKTKTPVRAKSTVTPKAKGKVKPTATAAATGAKRRR